MSSTRRISGLSCSISFGESSPSVFTSTLSITASKTFLRGPKRAPARTATIRLGDKSQKYKKGMVVQVLAGARFGPREKIFDAVIDKIEVKALAELSPREIEHDNPEIRRPEEMAHFLSQLYNREVTEADTVTVIRFSKIKPS